MIQERGCNLDDEQPPETLRNIPSQNHITPNQHEDRGAVDIQRQHHEHHATDALLCRGRGNTSIQTLPPSLTQPFLNKHLPVFSLVLRRRQYETVQL